MATPKLITESPKTTDIVKFELATKDSDDTKINPYSLNKVIVYFLVREFATVKDHQLDVELTDNITVSTFFNKAQVIKVFGSDIEPAWLSTDTTNSLLTKVGTGEFELEWTPTFAREGDYIVCWTWTPIIAGSQLSSFSQFFLHGDTQAVTSIPTHLTNPDKYPTLLERYLPEHVKLKLSDDDLTPDVIDKLNDSIAEGFVIAENWANQSVDLLDANAIHEQLIIFLANMFNLTLRSTDHTLWRRQIKNAVPLFKKKGTLAGLRQALTQAGIRFTSLTQFWQTVSPYTWQESFTVTGAQTQFELAKTVSDTIDFDLFLRTNGSSTYQTLTTADYATITFDDEDSVYLLNWIGATAPTPITLADGDIVRLIYNLKPIADQSIEDYIRGLQLKDQRDEATITFPMKNWNVYLIKDTDSMFDAICPTRHPFADDVVYGKVRTEFPYSENLYNMDEYNGSLRNSTDPCDLSKDFIDECGCCLSSTFDIDVEVEGLSTNRISEAEEIIDEYKPFHATIDKVNIAGGIDEILPPQEESVEMLVQINANDTLVNGNDAFTRVIEDGLIDPIAVKRDMLADVLAMTTATGVATNDAIALYSPDLNFDPTASGLDATNNLLEILTGPDAGVFTVANPGKSAVDIVQPTPGMIGESPLNQSSFAFNLSNELFDGSIETVTQDDVFAFSDFNTAFRTQGAVAGWKIQVTAPVPLIGTYTIEDTFPNDSVILSTWPVTTDSTGISFQLKDDADVDVGSASTTGQMTVTRRAKVTAEPNDFQTQFGVKEGDYIRISGTDYLITEFIDVDEFYIVGWTSGTMGSLTGKALRRLFDNALGFLDVNGMTIDTSPTDYEVVLSISNGGSALGPLLENNQFKENFLILMYGEYFELAQITGTTITLRGPKKTWGVGGTPVAFDFVQFDKTAKTIQSHDFEFIDRRNGDIVEIVQESEPSMGMMAMYMNMVNLGQPYELQTQQEGVSIEIDWND